MIKNWEISVKNYICSPSLVLYIEPEKRGNDTGSVAAQADRCQNVRYNLSLSSERRNFVKVTCNLSDSCVKPVAEAGENQVYALASTEVISDSSVVEERCLVILFHCRLSTCQGG